MTKKRQHPKPLASRTPRKTPWEDAEIVVEIKYTKAGTPLDDHLRSQQTRALLELLEASQDGPAEPEVDSS